MTDHAISNRRLPFIDNLRWSAISMVVVMHASVTYSSFGSWYYFERASLSLGQKIGFATYQSFQHAVSMGLLFGIAGYFAAASVPQKGSSGFLRERLVRLGVPLLLYTFLIGPLTLYYVVGAWHARPSFGAAWLYHFVDGSMLSETGPLWFCLVLLGFSAAYALLAHLRPALRRAVPAALPCVSMVFVFAAAIACATFAVGVIAPRGGTILNVSVHDFPQYPFMFAAGIMAWRHEWLGRIAPRHGARWLAAGLLGGGLLWAALVFGGGALSGQLANYGGGWHWQAAGMDVWRSATCLCLATGLIAIYRDHFNRTGPVARFLTRNAFGVYVFHAPILIAITRALHPWPADAVLKFAIASVAAIAATFLFVDLVVRHTPGLRAVA